MTLKPLVETAFGRPTKRKPVWFLRQAGRYLPEYMAIRKNTEFTTLCQTPKLAAEVTLQPLRRYDVDAAIIFSDILVPCMGMGQTLTFGKGHGPILNKPVRSAEDLASLRVPDCEKELGYVGDAIGLTKQGLESHQTMIGFAGAPFTVASYMIEGMGTKVYTEVKNLQHNHPTVFQGLLDKLVEVSVDYLLMQVKAGAECLMLFDTWANQLPAEDYRNYSFPAVSKIIAEVKDKADVPIVYYPGQGTDLYFELSGYQGDVIAVDWRTRMSRAISLLENSGLDVSVQGNLDPQTLMGPESVIRERTRAILDQGKKARGHIFNVGHGMQPHLSPDALHHVINEIRSWESEQ
ncbi:MAG: uroporphyrinogen decarboxylase [Pseudobacteriovorax sp.]|nr:uroporphyrinogen decarboxylase [Pseudobacteriovorax sp.]